MATLTWLGHASFRLDTDDGKRIYIDPFLQGNPKTPDSEKTPERCDVIAITHGHGDHLADVVDISKKFPDAEIVAMVELKPWLGSQGANVGDLPGHQQGRHAGDRRRSSSRSRTRSTRRARPTAATAARRPGS